MQKQIDKTNKKKQSDTQCNRERKYYFSSLALVSFCFFSRFCFLFLLLCPSSVNPDKPLRFFRVGEWSFSLSLSLWSLIKRGQTETKKEKNKLKTKLCLTSLKVTCSKETRQLNFRSLSFSLLQWRRRKKKRKWDRHDTQRGILPGISRKCKLRSKIWWFTEFCNSHYLSHFAAFFIVART